MDARVTPLADIFRLNTRLVHDCVDDLTASQFAGRAAPDQLSRLDGATLDAPAPQRPPGADGTILGLVGLVGFLAQHDSYHLGQLALVRRLYGLSAMRYGDARELRVEGG